MDYIYLYVLYIGVFGTSGNSSGGIRKSLEHLWEKKKSDDLPKS